MPHDPRTPPQTEHDHDHDHDHGHDHDGRDHGHGGQRHSASHHAGHDSHHGHSHGAHAHGSNATRIGIAALLTGSFMGIELIGGVMAGSLALIADAGHMLSDFGSLILAWVSFRIARRPADVRRTFGFRRFSVVAAFVNGLALVAVTLWIVAEAVHRLMVPHEVEATTMLWVAIAGLVANLATFGVLHGGDRSNLNIRGALLHAAGDLLGSLAAIVAAVIIIFTGWDEADPLLSILVSLIILRSAWSLIADSGHILLEGAPHHLDVGKVSADLAHHVPGVRDIHHAHAWSIDETHAMMTLHAQIADEADGPEVVALIKKRLAAVHGVDHATVEIEHAACSEPGCA